ncbi:hypothetical protein OE265_20880 [Mycobacteroides abscessus]|uniref:hypothetical protein n=1 Tax=Mycobacteroides abscessus TaxID=36809 RepID=UPI000C26053F|nr:hypothetical protein [Mycobacteroides abscessus]MCU8693950.1 hypothetical protein [Mycobacteroides abscessus]MCU8713158.1 hypothetical protein [Mycobacteroides abscessus]MCU8717903.1 hypothetical protein [Mycobacteroides abscessus]MCU8752289.1 hypothetical protein [Mycobacteroides abscessus]MCU8761521.1 hypothetical protein [Mycobacteroides abscessus]
MADINDIPWFKCVGLYGNIVPDTLDSGYRPDHFKPWGAVTFTPRIAGPDNKLDPPEPQFRLTAHTPPITLLLVPFDARIENGVLKLPRLDAPAGENPTPTEIDQQRASVGLDMIANSTALQLASGYKLVYQVQFGTMKVLGKEHTFGSFWFVAPTVADFTTEPTWTPPTIDLTVVERFTPVM